MAESESPLSRRRRERSARYPGASLDEAIEFARQMDQRGVDGLPAEAIATAMGHKSIRTHTFSARLSAARQFGLIALHEQNYSLTVAARSLLHPVNPSMEALARKRALGEPPLYADLCEKLAGKRVPEPAALANWLYHQHQITASAKKLAAEMFLQSARQAGLLGDDGVLVACDGSATSSLPLSADRHPLEGIATQPGDRVLQRGNGGFAINEESRDVEFRLALWGRDQGKTICVRAPESMSSESLQRFLSALRLHVRVDD